MGQLPRIEQKCTKITSCCRNKLLYRAISHAPGQPGKKCGLGMAMAALFTYTSAPDLAVFMIGAGACLGIAAGRQQEVGSGR